MTRAALPTLDIRFCRDLATKGLTENDLAGGELTTQALSAFRGRVERGEIGFPRLPEDSETPKRIASLARRAQAENFLLIGIGGSSLGAQALFAALRPWYHNALAARRRGARFYVLDNVDAGLVEATLNQLLPRNTIVNVVSKSGATAETAANFMIVRRWLKRSLGRKFASHIVATTDPEKGELLALARAEGYEIFSVPPNVGGRFSVLSPAGLLPAHFFGVSIARLLEGAREMARIGMNNGLRENLPLLSAHVLFRYLQRGRTTQVFMPYSSSLQPLADWYRQLWAESLGKKVNRRGETVHTGQTLLGSIGTIDQHSQVQLLREGPDDKIVFFLDVEKQRREVRVPRDLKNYPSSAYLGGHTLTELMRAESRSTQYALASDDRPSLAISIPRISERSIGALLMFFELQTAYMGEMLGIDAYDQPGVEEGKLNTFALMGRPGYEERRAALARFERV